MSGASLSDDETIIVEVAAHLGPRGAKGDKGDPGTTPRVYRPEDYGAVGDYGGHDDINALDLMVADVNADGGGIIYLTNGYGISRTFTLPTEPFVLQGTGRADTLTGSSIISLAPDLSYVLAFPDANDSFLARDFNVGIADGITPTAGALIDMRFATNFGMGNVGLFNGWNGIDGGVCRAGWMSDIYMRSMSGTSGGWTAHGESAVGYGLWLHSDPALLATHGKGTNVDLRKIFVNTIRTGSLEDYLDHFVCFDFTGSDTVRAENLSAHHCMTGIRTRYAETGDGGGAVQGIWFHMPTGEAFNRFMDIGGAGHITIYFPRCDIGQQGYVIGDDPSLFDARGVIGSFPLPSETYGDTISLVHPDAIGVQKEAFLFYSGNETYVDAPHHFGGHGSFPGVYPAARIAAGCSAVEMRNGCLGGGRKNVLNSACLTGILIEGGASTDLLLEGIDVSNNALGTITDNSSPTADVVIRNCKGASDRGVPPVIERNLLLNPDGAINQRALGATVGPGGYTVDRWYLLEAAVRTDWLVAKVADAATGYPSLIRITSPVAAQRVGLAQIIEAVDCKILRGQTVTLSATFRRSVNNAAIGIAVLGWTGTADAVTANIVNDWTSTTFTLGSFFAATNLALYGVVQSPLLTVGALTNLSLTVQLGSTFNNLIVFVFSQGNLDSGETLDFRAKLESGTKVTPFDVVRIEDELRRCQRYYITKVVQSENGARNISLPTMRIAPTVAVSVGSAASITTDGFELTHTAAAACTVTASAEL